MVFIELNSVTFSYPGSEEEPLVSAVSLTMSAGEWVAMVGSGPAEEASGVATLERLLKLLTVPESKEDNSTQHYDEHNCGWG